MFPSCTKTSYWTTISPSFFTNCRPGVYDLPWHDTRSRQLTADSQGDVPFCSVCWHLAVASFLPSSLFSSRSVLSMFFFILVLLIFSLRLGFLCVCISFLSFFSFFQLGFLPSFLYFLACFYCLFQLAHPVGTISLIHLSPQLFLAFDKHFENRQGKQITTGIAGWFQRRAGKRSHFIPVKRMCFFPADPLAPGFHNILKASMARLQRLRC